MKYIFLLSVLIFCNASFAQQNRVFIDQQLAHPKAIRSLVNYPSCLGSRRSQVIGIETRNLYIQSTDNVLMAFFYRCSIKRKWGFESQREGNGVFSQWTLSAVHGLKLKERLTLGVRIGLSYQRYPEFRKLGYSVELNAAYAAEKSLILFWYKSNEQNDLLSARPNAGFSFSYFFEDGLMLQSTLQLQSYRPPVINCILFQLNKDWSWFTSFQLNPLGGGIGITKHWGKFTLLSSFYYSLLPFPCSQWGWVYER